jgi:hypothetical protein
MSSSGCEPKSPNNSAPSQPALRRCTRPSSRQTLTKSSWGFGIRDRDFAPRIRIAGPSIVELDCAARKTIPGGDARRNRSDLIKVREMVARFSIPVVASHVVRRQQLRCRAFMFIVLAAVILWLPKTANLNAAPPATANDLEQLLAQYRDFGLPLVPDGAKLVRFELTDRYILNGTLMSPTYGLGFLIRAATKEDPAVVLVGTETIQLDPSRPVEFVEPKLELLKTIEIRSYNRSAFPINDGLAIAMQCHARGWNALARELWASSLKCIISDGMFGAYDQPPDLSDRMALAHFAWAYYGNGLVKTDTDRTSAAKRIKLLLASEKSLDTEVNWAILASLDAALVPSVAKRGTVEQLIDDLVDMCDTGRDFRYADPHYSRLAEKGFEAVPALIGHLDDDRLTRSVEPTCMNFPTTNLRVKDIVTKLLYELAGEDTARHWRERQIGLSMKKADADEWWQSARKDGEEAYFLQNVIPSRGKQEFPNELMLRIIAKRYPAHLQELYMEVVDNRSDIQSWPIAGAIDSSAIPDKAKRELFLHASASKDLAIRQVGLAHLQKIDSTKFVAILLATLQSLPTTSQTPYWRCPEAGIAHLVLRTDDPRAWQALQRAAKRSDVGLRMELMNSMDYVCYASTPRKPRLDFLASFLDDAEAPDVKANPAMFDGPHAGFSFDRLEVRDLAAMKIADILELSDRPDKNWTPEQWKQLREKVVRRLKTSSVDQNSPARGE